MEAAELADAGQWRARLGARRQLGRDRARGRRQDQGARRSDKGAEVDRAEVLQATRDSVRALMLIRAYRVRGHLHANLDPARVSSRATTTRSCIRPLRLHRGRLRPADLPRQRARPGVRHHPRDRRASCERTYCQTLGVEFMHISDPAEKAWLQERIEGPDKEITFTREGKRAILNKLVEAEGFEKFLDVKYTGTKRFGLDGARVDDPGAGADHQARRRARRQGDRARHGPPRPPQRARQGHGEAAPRDLPRIQGRLLHARRGRRLGRRQIPPRRLVRPRVRRQQRPPVAHRQPVAPRDRRPGGARQGARQAGPARRPSSAAPR